MGGHYQRARSLHKSLRLYYRDVIFAIFIKCYDSLGVTLMTYVMTNYYIILSNYIVPRIDSVLVCDPSCHKHYQFVDIISMLLFLAGDLELNPGPHDSPLDVSHNIKDLSLCHINVQSLVHKVDLVAVELSCHDIITISETWLDNSINN